MEKTIAVTDLSYRSVEVVEDLNTGLNLWKEYWEEKINRNKRLFQKKSKDVVRGPIPKSRSYWHRCDIEEKESLEKHSFDLICCGCAELKTNCVCNGPYFVENFHQDQESDFEEQNEEILKYNNQYYQSEHAIKELGKVLEDLDKRILKNL